ncbi:Kae1-like domain-containing protein [Hydrogenothermus marinus]|uniref:Hydrogenase maturation protein HypF n=1 Tax=Hydrogenothermus marinus TaxID=133270 RepID=A0A3M0BN11_9AQUI|nr:Sua5/YciO/YrdC/YwlC family protein [Hydrogenothermus marinus]RMA97854.1 hydrogenase maturation protein HypF [Hydrogenothermus marinus]
MKTIDTVKIKIEFEYYKGNENLFYLIKYIADKNKITGYLKRENDKVKIYIKDSFEKVEKFVKELGEKLPYSIFMGTANTVSIEKLDIEIKEGFKLLKEPNLIPQNLSTCPSCLEELFNPENRRFYYPFISCNYCGNHYSYLYEYPFKREKTVFKFFVPCEDCKRELENKESLRFNYELISCHKCLTPIYLKKGEHERYGFDNEKTVGAINTATGIIEKGNLIKVYTGQGLKIIGLINKKNISKVRTFLNIGRKPITILITNPSILNEIAFISDTEIKALASQEKPIVYLTAKEFKEKELVSNNLDFIKVKLPDEPLLILLAQHLKERGINYVFIEELKNELEEEITEFELNADLPIINKQKDTEVFVAQGKIIIKEGEKGILPNIIKSKQTGNLAIANDYAVLDLGNGEYFIDKKEKILFQLPSFVDKLNSVNILNGEYEDIKVPYKEKKDYKAYEGAILSILGEYNKTEEGVIGFYFSSKVNQDLVAVKTKIKSIKPAIWIKPIKIFKDFRKTVKWALEEIKSSSEEGRRLISNFEKKYPDIYNKFANINLDENGKTAYSITAVLNIASILLDIHPYDDISYFEEPYIYLQNEALDFKDNRGLMIDYFLYEENNVFYLNWIKTLQSILSYKIADVDNKMLAFSIFEGLADWMIEQINTISKKLKINNVALAGDFFSNPILTGRIIKHAKGKYPILINRKLPIDNQNIAFGGIFI